MAYLCRNNIIEYVCTEDSDLIAYGCKKIIYKLNFKTGTCKIITSDTIFNDEKSPFFNWEYSQFLHFCILSGCDFFKAPKIGPKSAYKLLDIYKSCYEIPNSNIDIAHFKKALKIFTSQIVYCPISFKQITLDNTPPHENDIYSEITANLTVKAYIDPNTLLPF